MKLMARKLTFTLTWLELTRVFFVIMRRMNFLWKRSPESTTVGYSESSTDYCHPTKSCIVFVAEHTRKNYAVWFIISLIFLPDLTVHTVERWKRSPESTTVGYSESSTDYCHPTKSCIVFVAEHTRKNYAVWFIISLIFLPDLTVHTVEPPERKETWKELSRSFNGRWFKALNPAKKERQVWNKLKKIKGMKY